MKHRTTFLQRTALSAAVIAMGALSSGAQAAILSNTPESAELFLVVIDPVNAKMSYTLDLGKSAMEFWITAQQDSGASFFKSLDPATDSRFQTFISAANPATTSWMLLGFGSAGDGVNRTAFTTLTNNGSVAKQTASFDTMKTLKSPVMADGVLLYEQNVLNAMNGAGPAEILASTHNTAEHGSAVASKDAGNTSTYFSRDKGFGESLSGAGDGSCVLGFLVCAGNPIGTSSWFYRLTPTLVDPTDPAAGIDDVGVKVDEFDNLTADGYWGFIKDPASAKYILSYTLNGTSPRTLASTDAGQLRVSSIDYSAQSGSARLIGGLGADDVAFQVGAVSAVPEPGNWALMLAGMATIAGARRLRRAKQN